MQVVWKSTTNFASMRGLDEQTWDNSYWVYRPNSEKFKKLPADLDWVAFLNELGADGWELVAERVQKSVVLGQSQGWKDVGSPILIFWTFKRPAEG